MIIAACSIDDCCVTVHINIQAGSGGSVCTLLNYLGDGAYVQVWEAIQELKTEAAWKVESIMQFATAFEAQLATGQPHDLPALQAPKQPPVDSSLSASEVMS